jgi:hypothetical protein
MVEVGRFKNGSFQPSFPQSPNLPAIRACHASENFRKTLRRVNKNASYGLTVESAEVGFIAGEEGLAPVLDGRGEHGPVFFRQEKVEAWDGQGRRSRQAGERDSMASSKRAFSLACRIRNKNRAAAFSSRTEYFTRAEAIRFWYKLSFLGGGFLLRGFGRGGGRGEVGLQAGHQKLRFLL